MENKKFIRIRGAAENNLKHIDLDIPRDELVVLTGLSGSGKSSLAFDTIYAEGQRRDVYKRQYYLYADFSSDDISSTDFKTLNGKRIGVLIGAKPEVMLKEWELKNKLKTIHVNIESRCV